MKKLSILLLHGAWHGSWCWTHLTPLLENKGVNILAPDLPGRTSASNQSVSLSDYVEFVTQLIEHHPTPIFIVAHSLAGVIASQLPSKILKKIHGILYVGAFLLKSGQSVFDIVGDNPSAVSKSLIISKTHISLAPETAKKYLYNNCPPVIANWASERLCPEPITAMATPIYFDEAQFSQLNLHYFLCGQDQGILPVFQKKMCDQFPSVQIINAKNSDHSPFLSQPKEFAHVLETLTK